MVKATTHSASSLRYILSAVILILISASLARANDMSLLKLMNQEQQDTLFNSLSSGEKTGNLKCVDDNPATKASLREIYSKSLTVLINKDNILPLRNLQDLKIAIVELNRTKFPVFQNRLLDYHPADTFRVCSDDENQISKLISRLSEYDLVIAGIYDTCPDLDTSSLVLTRLGYVMDNLPDPVRTIVTYFGNPNWSDNFNALRNVDGLVLAYEDNEFTEDLSAQLIFGGIGACGTLPGGINSDWPEGSGITTPGNLRLQYGLPENAGISSEFLNRKIDSIVNLGLIAGAYPGCEVMVARKGIVLFHKVYGFHTYENLVPVRKDDLYDLASVTKISSTLAGLMLLDSEGKFSPEKKLGDYLPDFRRTNKGDLLMKDLLTHQAGLQAWIPFWRETVRADSSLKRRIFSHEYSEKYPIRVANNLYINKNYRKKIFKEIKKSPIGEKKYVYSDLTFIISTGIIDNLTGEKWYDFVTRNIYHKLGAFDICFNPYMKYPLSRIVPTEFDSLFRRQLLHGTVHDEGAAMLGGISGHAGLFATANDLMKLMELYRRMGEYGGEQIIDRKIMEEYTRVQFPENDNRRGLGFDKPLLDNQDLGPAEAYPAKSATAQSFGHSGYTGTFVWIDPVYEISYIFLSNRVYPTRNNNLLSDMNIRPYILQAVYDSVKSPPAP
jgi:CubicO group peptidase (beta-lactamase class C family)